MTKHGSSSMEDDNGEIFSPGSFNIRTIVSTETNDASKESHVLSFLVPEVHQYFFFIIFIT